MKKSLYFVAAAAAMLAACSSHEDVSDANPAGVDGYGETDPVEIVFGVSSSAVQTRGAGTVGGLEGEDDKNVWNSQPLYIYMTKKNSSAAGKPATMVLATYSPAGGQSTSLYEDAPVFAPNGMITGPVEAQNHDVKYYPLTGEYDFWGYYLGESSFSANHNAPTLADANRATASDAETAAMYLQTFEIDGTQDIMQGKAVLSAQDSTNLDIVAGEDNSSKERYYSSYSARRGVQPNIYFNHLLTRFTFNVKPGNASTAGKGVYDENTNTFAPDSLRKAVKVESIKLYSHTKGDLMVAYTPDAIAAGQPIIKFDKTLDSVALVLKQRDTTATALAELQNLEPVSLDSVADKYDATKSFNFDGASHTIGDALLVEPDLDSITVEITLSQEVVINSETKGTEVRTQVLTKKLSAKNLNADGKFLQGHSYEVNITAFGYENIEIYATLVPWKDGGSIDENTDEVDNWDIKE